jgi:hypothetical protein
MKYFSKFPNMIVTSNSRPVAITDFLRRVSISDKFRENSVVLEDYFIQDGETPEQVSYKLYGTPAYHWVILMVNDITNPREEWPILDAKVTDLVYLKYDFKITVPDGTEYTANDVITSDNDGKFLVSKVVDDVVHMRSQVGKILLTTSNTLTNVTTETEDLTITSIIDPEEDVHHYYDTELGYIVDEDYSMNTVPVTNYTYEVEENDAKRTIKVLDPALIPTIEQEFDSLIRGE